MVISLGGSIISKDEGLDVKYLREFSKTILAIAKDHQVFIVVGGGRTARRYIEAAREFGAPESFLDNLGIAATRLNAGVVSASLKDRGLGYVPENIDEASESQGGKIFVMGGTVPGHSTDAVSAMLASHIGADLLINATNVDGVYERDPKIDPEAKRFESLTTKELLEIVETEGYTAGTSTVFDPKAARIIDEIKIKTCIIDGRQVKNISAAIKGECKGTTILG